MASWAFPQGLPQAEAALSSSWPTFASVTASGTAHTKGSYVDLVAATANEWHGFTLLIQPTQAGATNTATLMDIAIGGSGSERVIVADLPVGALGAATGITAYQRFIPLRVPAGERVSARCQSAVTSKVVSVGIVGAYGRNLAADPPAAFATTYGTDAANSRGRTVAGNGSVVNTYGTWVQLSSGITAPIRSMLLGLQITNAAAQNRFFDVRIGVGGSGSEADSYAHVNVSSHTNEGVTPGSALGLVVPITGLDIPEGEPLSASLASDFTNANALDVSVVGFTY